LYRLWVPLRNEIQLDPRMQEVAVDLECKCGSEIARLFLEWARTFVVALSTGTLWADSLACDVNRTWLGIAMTAMFRLKLPLDQATLYVVNRCHSLFLIHELENAAWDELSHKLNACCEEASLTPP